jgi:2-haloacid dehalogenase
MIFNRRTVLGIAAASAAAQALADPSAAASAPPIKAIAFDGFPILDPRPVFVAGKTMYSGNGDAFVSLFQTRGRTRR